MVVAYKHLLMRILQTVYPELHQIHKLTAVEDKGEISMPIFWGKKVEGQGHS